MKIKDLKEFCKQYDDEYVVGFCEFSHSAEAFVKPVKVTIRPRLPKKTEFAHEECKYYEEIEVKGRIRGFCNLKDKFLTEHSWHSCGNFASNNDVEYCMECDECDWNYGCRGISKE